MIRGAEANFMTDQMPKTVVFDYLKTQHYREFFVNGVYGGLTPKGYLQMTVFNERRAIPKQTSHAVDSNGLIGDEITNSRLTRESIIRSVDATLYMDIDTAEKTVEWMKKHIKIAKELQLSEKDK